MKCPLSITCGLATPPPQALEDVVDNGVPVIAADTENTERTDAEFEEHQNTKTPTLPVRETDSAPLPSATSEEEAVKESSGMYQESVQS